MTMDQRHRPHEDRWRPVLFAILSMVISTIAMSFLWKKKSFFALIGVFLFVTGGYVVLPWKTPIRKAISIGIWLGIALSTALFYLNILGAPQ
jgi:hypothetical protein